MLKKFVILFVLLIAVVACKDDKSHHEAIETEEIQFVKDGELRFFDVDDELLKKVDIEVAQTDYEQQTGLMYRKEMKEDRGMLFIYNDEKPRPYFYMKNTYIGLDLIYISADKKVVDINENAEPLNESTLPSDAPAQYVLEVNAGKAAAWKLKVGDKVSFDYQ